MCDMAIRHVADEERHAWYHAAMMSKRRVAALVASWGGEHSPWYGDNSREPLRNETFRGWQQHGAIRRDESIPTTSPKTAVDWDVITPMSGSTASTPVPRRPPGVVALRSVGQASAGWRVTV